MIAYLRNRQKMKQAGARLVFLCTILLTALAVVIGHHGEEFRLHIIANSDSRADQAVKLLVRDELLTYLNGRDADNLEQYVREHTEEVEAVAEDALERRGFSYGATALVGPAEYPWRILDGKAYPAGRYESIRVVLGDGNGQNWWCILFPPFSLVDVEQAEEEEVEYKSFLVELWESIFGTGSQGEEGQS